MRGDVVAVGDAHAVEVAEGIGADDLGLGAQRAQEALGRRHAGERRRRCAEDLGEAPLVA